MKDIICLAIESSCDETSAAVIKNGREILSNVIFSQIDIHKKYGGVVPEIASRKHTECINVVIEEALEKANVGFDDIDIIGATYGPGLVGALLVGLSAAKGISYARNIPLVPVNHIKGHIFANFLQDTTLIPPFLCMVVSGGHTHLINVKSYSEFEILGKTMDDAIGEAFDKVARTVGLGYPGGPIVDKEAKNGVDNCNFPRPTFDNLNFSFSGIKTAVINYTNKHKDFNVADVCRSFEEAATDVIITNVSRALDIVNTDKIAIAGGVAANSMLREKIEKLAKEKNVNFYCPSLVLCTDNAAMIGCAAYYDYLDGKIAKLDVNAIPNLSL